MRGILAVCATVALLAAGCTSAGTPPSPQRSSSPPQPVKAALVLLAAGEEGAVAVDRTTDSLIGFDRVGARVWTETAALKAGATFVCLRQCPQAVLSYGYVGQGPDRSPRRAGSADPFTASSAHRIRVLAARSAEDMVLEETDESGRTSLRLVGHGRELKVEVAQQDQAWVESSDRAHAIAFTRVPGAPASATIRWFTRDASGWRPTGDILPRGRAWNGCLGDGGAVALVAGREPALILRREQRVELRVDLPSVGECGIGSAGGVVVQRSIAAGGQMRTAVRGIDLDGRQTWARDFAGEALVATDISGVRAAVAYDGKLEILDATGKVTYSEPGVGSAVFVGDGALVIATLLGTVRRQRLADGG